VNRQRSLFQAGKLRKDRQQALERVGLKWSMLATTSWDSMYDTLCDYVQSKTKDGSEWDGNVPANYRTEEDNPPRALGRWINRQRSAYGKDKLKTEYIEKLNKIGLKWSVHERRPVGTPDSVTSTPSPNEGPEAIATIRTPAAQAADGITTARAALLPIIEETAIDAVKAPLAATACPPVAVKTEAVPSASPAIAVAPKPQTATAAVIATPTATKSEDDGAIAAEPAPDTTPSSVPENAS
jgi:hypothetical protein